MQIRLPRPKDQPPRRKRPPIVSTAEMPICGICKTQFSRYHCPACNLPYCSLACFRSPEHAGCSEAFDRQTLVDEIKTAEGKTGEEKRAMMDMLKRFEEDNADEGNQDEDGPEGDEEREELEKRLEGIDLDALPPEELLALLSPAQQAAFNSTLSDPARVNALVMQEFQGEYPWWVEEDQEEEELEDGEEPEVKRPPMLEASQLPPLTVGEDGKVAVTEKLVYNLVAVVFAYAYTLRTFSLTSFASLPLHSSERIAALQVLAQLVPFLVERSSTAFDDLGGAVTYVVAHEEAMALSPPLVALLLHDVARLLHPAPVTAFPDSSTASPLATHPLADLLYALSDLHHLFSNAAASAAPPTSDLKPSLIARPSTSTPLSKKQRAQALMAAHKLHFYAAVIAHSSSPFEPLHLGLIAQRAEREAQARETEGEAAEKAIRERQEVRSAQPLVIPTMSRLASSFAAPTKPQLRDSLWLTSGYLNGQWTSGSASESFDVINPGTGEKMGSLPDMTVEDTKQAVKHAHEALKTWRKTSEYERSAILQKIFQIMSENSEDLAQIITAENGKPLADARGEVTYGASYFSWYAGEALRNYGDVIPSAVKGVQNTTIKQPIGVCGIITPWNFPNAMVTRKLAAALAAGNTVVLKAPSETPYSVLAIAEIARRAGVPDGVINVILTSKHTADVGKELCENPLVHKISFTGSTRVGKILMKQASSTLKKLSFELGGNAPFIVFDDADIDKAIAGVLACKFRQSGQTCVCANRVYVQSGIYDAFASKLADAVRNFKVGEGTGEGITHGPLIHQAAVDKVHIHVEDAKKAGAKVVVGGKKMDLPGYFYEPTVLTEVQSCAIDNEETFGPLAALYRFETEEEVIARANDTEVGLAGYFFTENIARLHRVAAGLEVGMVGANTGAISQAAIPFGGIKESGFGREGSKYGLQDWQNIKLVSIGGL
ncbi:hypothetical protein JCM21900_003611 [Sporobolomyces salmonicolor]